MRCVPERFKPFPTTVHLTPTQKKKLESNAYKAFSHYLAVRYSCRRGQAPLIQLARALARFDRAFERLNHNGQHHQ